MTSLVCFSVFKYRLRLVSYQKQTISKTLEDYLRGFFHGYFFILSIFSAIGVTRSVFCPV